MLDTEKLRKADIFSGTFIFLLGLFIVSQALKMPMKDSYAGVQNVWYVSPALFPLFVGAILAILGLFLMKTAIKAVGRAGFKSVFNYFGSSDFVSFLKQKDTIRYYAIILNLLVFVFILVPRVDFFLAAIFFLLIFFFQFYCGNDQSVLSLIYFQLICTTILIFFLLFSIHKRIAESIPYALDLLTIAFIICLLFIARKQQRIIQDQIKKYKISMFIAFVAPFTIGIIFKYFLLVPMPFEGLVVSVLDAIWYADFWS